MRQPDQMKTPGGSRALGDAAVQRASDRTNDRPQGATIAQRRAASIRLQAIGQVGGA